jgi:hypothetical protein
MKAAAARGVNRVTTEYHTKLYAQELGKRHSVADAEKLAGALLDAQVDLNPHQVEAALFAFKSPPVKGRDPCRRSWPRKNH